MSKLEKIASKYTLSDDAISYVHSETIAPSLYADSIRLKYPVHTKVACEVSMAEFLYDGCTDELVKSRLDKFASIHGVMWPQEIPGNSMIKVGTVLEDGDRFEVEFPDTAKGVEAAIESVLDFRKTAAYEPSVELAKGVLKEAFKHNCEVPDEFMRLAGYGLGTKEAALSAISKRASYAVGSDAKKALEQLEDDIMSMDGDIIAHDDLAKIAKVLDAFDGLREDRGYTTYNTPPEQELFNKLASDIENDFEDRLYIPSVGTVVSKSDLTKHASQIMPILDDMGIDCTEDNMLSTVAKLNEKQANALFGELNG